MNSIKNKIVYRLNNDKFKEFCVLKSKKDRTFFLINDFSNLENEEVVRLLNNNRRLVICDNAIIDIEKIIEIKKLLNDDFLFKNLLISKECYLQTWFHKYFFHLLEELEISEKIDIVSVIESDIPLHIGIKIKFFDNPEYLLKSLDGSLYLKKLTLEKFYNFSFDLGNEYNKLMDFYKEIKDNVIISSLIFFENFDKNYGFICNVIDNKNTAMISQLQANKEGIISCYDYSYDVNARMDSFSKKLVKIDYCKKVGWIDAVKIRKLVNELLIDTIVLENFDCYNDLKEIKICTEYGFNFTRTKNMPLIDEGDSVIPLYSRLEGWRLDINKIEDPTFVPHQFLKFIHETKKQIGAKKIIARLNKLEITI